MAALARVERTDFLSPVCIGEVANVSAEITYTSRHSVEVQVNVMSENILTGGWLPAALSQSSGNNCGVSRELAAVTPFSAHRRQQHWAEGRSCLFIDSAGGSGEGWWCWEGKPSRLPGDYGSVDHF